jgi:membrane associated rhomboid family serine protease
MAWQDRPYNRERSGAPGQLGNYLPWSSVTTWLAGINFIVYLIDVLTSDAKGQNRSPLKTAGAYTVEMALQHGQLWRVVTYQFLHEGLMHIVMNLLGLVFLGPMMESHFGKKRFLAFYLLCGTSGALLFTIGALIPGLPGGWAQSQLVGASGSIFGILFGAALVAPSTPMAIMFLPITFTLRTFAWVSLGLSVLLLAIDMQKNGGQAAHLGGAAMGWLLVKHPWLLNWAGSGAGYGAGYGAASGGASRSPRYAGPRAATAEQEKKPNVIKQWLDQREEQAAVNLEKEVDRILAKVHDHGLQSLTEREKNTLSEATKKQQQRRSR